MSPPEVTAGAAAGFRRNRRWLVIGLLLINGLLVLYNTMSALASRERVVEQVRRNAASLANLVQRNLSDLGLRVDAALLGVVDEIDRQGGIGDRDGARGTIRPLTPGVLERLEVRLPLNSTLQVVDASGRLRWPAAGSAGPQPDWLAHPLWRQHREAGLATMRVGAPLRLDPGGAWVVPFTRALRSPDGELAGLVVLNVPLAPFARLLAGIDAGEHGLLLLRDGERGVIAFSRPVSGPPGQIGSRLITPQASALLDTGANFGSYDAPTSPDGVARTYAFHWARSVNMVVGVGMAPQDYLANWRHEVGVDALVTLFFFIITSAAAFAVQRGWRQLALDIALRERREAQLRDSEQRLSALVAASPDWVFETNADDVHTYASPRVLDVLGLTPAQVVGRSLFDLLPSAEADRLRKPLGLARAQALPIDLAEVEHCHADGSLRIVEMRATPVLDDAGAVSGYRGIARDVTELRRLDRTLARSEARLRRLIEESPLAIQVVSDQGVVLSVNRAWEALWGVPFTALSRYNMLQDAQLLAAGMLQVVRQVLAGEQVAPQVTHYDRSANPAVPGGSGVLVVKTHIYANRDDEGSAHEFVLVQEDITQLWRAEEELRRHREQLEQLVERRTEEIRVQQAKLQNILDGIPGVVGYWDSELRNGFANGGYTEWLGLPLERVLGHRIDEIFAPDHLARIQPILRRVMAGESVRFSAQFPHPSGQGVRHAEIHYVPDRQRERVVGFFVLAFDISELVHAKEAADAASVAKSAFLANMSHEIRTPLNGILGLAQVMLRSGVSPQQKQQIDKIAASGRHLLRILNDVLDLAKIDAGKLSLVQGEFELRTALSDAVAIIEPGAAAKGLSLAIEAAPTLPTRLGGDAARLCQALVNYLGNAVKFTDVGGIVLRCLLLQRSADSVVLRFEVQDSGIGISPAHQQRLFQAFEQIDDSSTRAHGGSGLGLTITRQIAELMGGATGVSSVPGEGSTFWMTACFVVPALQVTDAVEHDAEDAEAMLLRLHAGKRVLLAEDEAVNREVAAALLGDVGLVVDMAYNGQQAVELARLNRHDLILMDMQMPVLDGLAATRQIRADPAITQRPIVAMTANAFEQDSQRCFEAGMNDFIAKPVDVDLLFAKVLRWLN
ncbi:MAG: hypothetical protein RIQ60_3880 [Pseudomonadota bacterium]|jgi:PAS domain S-box-containing protein